MITSPSKERHEERTLIAIQGFNHELYEGAEFDSIESIRAAVTNYGEKHNIAIVTFRSSLKRQTITMTCKHSKDYRNHRNKEELERRKEAAQDSSA
ncbi:uncharacterized protein RHIMIDRAFT_280373, partial [Rhizopus microsporus ATCC 52813]